MSNEVAIDLADCQRVDLGSRWLDSYPILIRRARNLTAGGGQDPEDLVSQATLKVLNYLNIEREVDNFVGLMLVSLRQVYLDSNRRNGNRIFSRAAELTEDHHSDLHSANPCVERSYIAKEMLGDIFDCLTTLPQSSQELFQLRFVSELSYAEIAAVMDITEASARQKVKKLRDKLQSWIEN